MLQDMDWCVGRTYSGFYIFMNDSSLAACGSDFFDTLQMPASTVQSSSIEPALRQPSLSHFIKGVPSSRGERLFAPT